MSRVSPLQMKKLLDLLSQDGVLHNGKVVYTNTNKQCFWKQIATQLNSVDGGVYKNTWKWCKMWADWKNKTKKKASILLRRNKYNLEQSFSTLTNLELRLLKLIEYPMEDNTETMQTEYKYEVTVNEGEDNDDYPNVNYATENTEYVKCENGCLSSMDISNDEKLEESPDLAKKDRVKGKLHKKKKISLHEYKMKIAIALQKEKSHQKTEELRLKALELKLKGEELRLKEMEMNKINYLTNIEEEKLKCFRDISLYLKEFVEQSRSGNARFHNVI